MFDRRVFSPYSRFFLNQGHCIENKIGTNTAQVLNTYSLTSYKWHIKNSKCACAHLYIHVHGKTSQLYLSIDWNFKLRVIARDQRVCTTITWCIFAYFSAIESSSTPSQTRLSLAHLRRQAHQLVRHPLIRALEIPHQQWREFFIFWCEKRKCSSFSTCNSKIPTGASNILPTRCLSSIMLSKEEICWLSLPTCTTRSANSMSVSVNVTSDVKVDHRPNVRDVQTASCR